KRVGGESTDRSSQQTGPERRKPAKSTRESRRAATKSSSNGDVPSPHGDKSPLTPPSGLRTRDPGSNGDLASPHVDKSPLTPLLVRAPTTTKGRPRREAGPALREREWRA